MNEPFVQVDGKKFLNPKFVIAVQVIQKDVIVVDVACGSQVKPVRIEGEFVESALKEFGISREVMEG